MIFDMVHPQYSWIRHFGGICVSQKHHVQSLQCFMNIMNAIYFHSCYIKLVSQMLYMYCFDSSFVNFRTYDSVEFHTGPSLNVIIGPNGTGKSSIVCAICLGLGGKTGLLGRAQQLGDYIKYGCQKAKIELEL
jgi:putative ribosome biogenesis GTPase RsgA